MLSSCAFYIARTGCAIDARPDHYRGTYYKSFLVDIIVYAFLSDNRSIV